MTALEDSRDILENAPCGFVISDLDGLITFVNAKIVEWSGRTREELLGGMRFQELLSKAGRIYFETHVAPLLLMQGHVSEISTHIERPGKPQLPVFINSSVSEAGQRRQVRSTIFDATDRAKYEQELRLRRREAERLVAIQATSPDAILTLDLELTVQSWNDAAAGLFGYTAEEAIGRQISDLVIPEDRRDEELAFIRSVLQGGRAIRESVRKRKSGELVPTEIHAAPVVRQDGEIEGIIGIVRDISERKRTEQRVRSMMEELKHRSKNILSVVQVIARQTARRSRPDTFLEEFSERLRSLAASQDMLGENSWQGADLEALIRAQIGHLDAGPTRMVLKGSPAIISARPAEAIGMAIHELATNAAKYGALSRETGNVLIEWTMPTHTDHFFTLSWTESGGPMVKPPGGKGFGSVVLGALIEAATEGNVDFAFASSGVQWRLKAPSSTVLESS